MRWWKTALTANSTDPTFAIVDLKFNHLRECNTADLKIYSQSVHLKKYYMRIVKYMYFFEFHESAFDSAEVTICKVQNSII